MKRFVLCLFLVVAGCGGGGGGNSDDETTVFDVELQDGTVTDAPLTDGPLEDKVVPVDHGEEHYIPPETADHSVTPPDTGKEIDVVDVPDVPKDEYVPPDGELGAPCVTDVQCVSQLCLDGPKGRVCSGSCQTGVVACPPGFTCVSVIGFGTEMCIPTMVSLCRPCNTNQDCLSNSFDVGDKCISLGSKGSFCGGNCSGGQACPFGYECHGMIDISGKPSDQCVRMDAGCECTELWINEGAWTNCYNQNLYGKCQGDRFCSLTGLTQCSAPVPSEEVCNGEDDNCDGQIDEGVDDNDKDGLPDCIDDDDDDDNVADFADNCVLAFNPGQEDMDKDSTGDACDDDIDGDGDPNSTDCASTDPDRFHGNEEACDGVDNDCAGGIPADEFDNDQDGLKGCEGDCNDANGNVFPGAAEDCETSYDDDCDGDNNPEDAMGCTNYFKDEDADGYGDPESKCLCKPTAPYISDNSMDCDDTKFEVRPGVLEDCATADVDENCDGNFNMEGGLNCQMFYLDADEDGFGTPQAVCACEPAPPFNADNVLDCNDGNPDVNPDAEENCFTLDLDDNCNGTHNDMDAAGCSDWWEDKDSDGFGVGEPVCICEPQSVFTAPNGEDCDDGNQLVFPGQVEKCSTEYDDNCNGDSNEADAQGCQDWWVDQDGDGYAGTPLCYCEAPGNAEDYPEDCCDQDPNAFPGQTKYYSEPVNWCGGFDFNCDDSEEPQYDASCVQEPCSAGWFQPTPGCGKTGNWCLNCAGCGSCIGQTISQKQKCR